MMAMASDCSANTASNPPCAPVSPDCGSDRSLAGKARAGNGRAATSAIGNSGKYGYRLLFKTRAKPTPGAQHRWLCLGRDGPRLLFDAIFHGGAAAFGGGQFGLPRIGDSACALGIGPGAGGDPLQAIDEPRQLAQRQAIGRIGANAIIVHHLPGARGQPFQLG